MQSHDRLADFKVHEIKTLGKASDAEAKRILGDVARQVQPVMRKRGWTVPQLSEFYPSNPNLLGLNINGGGGHTQEIKIRLRPAGDEAAFYPFEHVLGTMLHELVHNVRGPHDSVFYKLLDEITQECEEFMAKGVTGTGQGFDGPSAGRLGSHSFIPTHNPPASQLRSVAAQAAEARAKKQRLMPQGPCKLGGSSTQARNMTPAQAAAWAAERRARDNVWCPCDHSPEGGIGMKEAQEVENKPLPAQPAPASSLPAPQTSGGLQAPQAAAKQRHQQQPVGPSAGPNDTKPLHVQTSNLNAANKSGSVMPNQKQRQQPHPQQAAMHPHQQPAQQSHDVVDLTEEHDSAIDAAHPMQPAVQALMPLSAAAAAAIARSMHMHDGQHPVISVQSASSSQGMLNPHSAGHANAGNVQTDTGWECPICTLLNRPGSLVCNACAGLRPVASDSSHTGQESCWQCSACTYLNDAVARVCEVCATAM